MTRISKRLFPRFSPVGILLSLILAIANPAPCAGEHLGRLFTTPEHRARLDRQRAHGGPSEKKSEDHAAMLTINGIVTRNDGERSIWINGVVVSEADIGGGLSLRSMAGTPHRLIVKFGDAQPAHAGVGDTIHRATGKTTPLLGDGAISRSGDRRE